jgi:hypothetical protein
MRSFKRIRLQNRGPRRVAFLRVYRHHPRGPVRPLGRLSPASDYYLLTLRRSDLGAAAAGRVPLAPLAVPPDCPPLEPVLEPVLDLVSDPDLVRFFASHYWY